MRKAKYILFSFLLLISLSNVNAITSSGQVPASEKETIYPKGYTTSCKATGDRYSAKYSYVGGYYSAYLQDTNKKVETFVSDTMYTDEISAKKACEEYISNPQNKDKGYLCKGTQKSSGYACILEGNVTLENNHASYPNVNIDIGEMYVTETDCNKNCSTVGKKGTCELNVGYKYTYTLEKYTSSAIDGEIKKLNGDIYLTKGGGKAFCIQPSMSMACNNDGSPNYCLNNQFDLNTCNTVSGYNSDYRCGMSYIVLKATQILDKNDELSDDEYAIADIALRMWAAYKGKLKGTTIDSVPGNESEKKNIKNNYLFAITAKRVVEDSNYISDGFNCNTDPNNIAVICTYKEYSLYKKAIKLFKDALEVNQLDVNGNPVPKLITRNIDQSTTEIQITKPCDPSEDGCQIKVILKDPNGKIVDEDDNVTCTKNICTAEISGEKTCIASGGGKYSVEVQISNFKSVGTVKEYHNCRYPNSRQIMFVFNAEGIETTDTFVKSYEIANTCSNCVDKNLKTTVTSTSKNPNSCNGNTKFGEGDYDGYDEITISEPEIEDILGSCEKESFREEINEVNTGGFCKVYCRKETKIYVADKTKVFSGMQFTYKLEEKIQNSQKTDEHISSIVKVERECASEIYYDDWYNALQDALKEVASTWTEWKRWEALYKLEVEDKNYPGLGWIDKGCTANCDALPNDKTMSDYCESISTPSNPSNNSSGGSKTLDEVCNNKKLITTNGIIGNTCNPACHYYINWYARKETSYQKYQYSKGSLIASLGTSSFRDGEWPESYLSCEAKDQGHSYQYHSSGETCSGPVNRNGSGTTSPGQCSNFLITKPNEKTKKECNDKYKSCTPSPTLPNEGPSCCESKTIQEIDDRGDIESTTTVCVRNSSGYNSTMTSYKQLSSQCQFNNNGKCYEGKNADENYVKNKNKVSRQAYYSAQERVKQLLTYIQNCSLFGAEDWTNIDGFIPKDSEIKYYKTTVNGSSSGTSESGWNISFGDGGVGEGGGSDATDSQPSGSGEGSYGPKFEEQSSTIDGKEYNSLNLLSTTNDYLKINISRGDTASNNIKKRILSNATCLIEGSCPELYVEYVDSSKKVNNVPVRKTYGEKEKYSKVANVTKEENIINTYCRNENCANESGPTKYYEDILETVKIIECDNSKETVFQKSCKLIPVQVPKAKVAKFTVTTELMYYRPNIYYTENYTGKVVEIKSNTRVDEEKYAKLGKNIYPIYDVETGIYPIDYEFVGIGSGKYYNISSNNQTGLKLNNFEYSCAYEAYNTTTQYDCEGEDCFGPQDPDSDKKTCVYIDNTSADLSTTHTWTESNITTNGQKNKKTYGFMFKNINLKDPFPNGRMGNNWKTSMNTIDEIKASSEDMYTNKERLELSVTLTTDAIKKIREYNRSRETNAGGYQDDSLRDCEIVDSVDGKSKRFANCRSSFIDEIETGSGVLGIKANEIKRGGE